MADKSPNPEFLDIDDLSEEEDPAPRTRLSKRAAGKAKGTSSVEDMRREIRALELQVKGLGNELLEVGERLCGLLDALPSSL